MDAHLYQSPPESVVRVWSMFRAVQPLFLRLTTVNAKERKGRAPYMFVDVMQSTRERTAAAAIDVIIRRKGSDISSGSEAS